MNIINNIIQASKSKNKIIRVVHRAALIYAIFLTVKKFFVRNKTKTKKKV